MKREDKPKYNRIVLSRERKRFYRYKKLKQGGSKRSPYYRILEFKKKVDRVLIKKFRFPLYEFLTDRDFINGEEITSGRIEIPEDFSFSTNYSGSIDIIRDFVASIMYSSGRELHISFKKCIKTDQAALFVFQILKLDITERLLKLDNILKVLSSKVIIKIEPSETDIVNKMLFVNALLTETEVKMEGLMPKRGIGYLKGSKTQRHYSENRKGAITTKIRSFINDCLKDHGHEFNSEGINEMDGLLSEILGNGEDHSPFDTYYATANSFMEVNIPQSSGIVGEVNLSVMNFGYSIYEGLETTKTENYINYGQIEAFYNKVYPLIKNRTITKENLFSLYALQEGISRLKFEDSSRGHGTMKFIKSFFALGDFEDIERHYHPELSIISGSTQVICNNKYRPFTRNEQNFLSLNSQNDLLKPPDPSNLKHLKTSFPGTLLIVKMYLHNEHLSKKIDGEK